MIKKLCRFKIFAIPGSNFGSPGVENIPYSEKLFWELQFKMSRRFFKGLVVLIIKLVSLVVENTSSLGKLV